ncbi:hypothetical protein JAAARDRAFT_31431 [Jaapia argillacea MUCL 33604]|uniref:Uncharacterized protein n=1 Tax=Jaapia argillacea MUCL 33604 TaxID=933084 RepID=A0A067Q4H5_9AGAM|nr:hypothetical protein JAAARDRAFT_31431 [Jaapia argillacea MUCL 33604]
MMGSCASLDRSGAHLEFALERSIYDEWSRGSTISAVATRADAGNVAAMQQVWRHPSQHSSGSLAAPLLMAFSALPALLGIDSARLAQADPLKFCGRVHGATTITRSTQAPLPKLQPSIQGYMLDPSGLVELRLRHNLELTRTIFRDLAEIDLNGELNHSAQMHLYLPRDVQGFYLAQFGFPRGFCCFPSLASR